MSQKGKTKIPIKVEFTDGYRERFSIAVLKIHEKRLRNKEKNCDSEVKEGSGMREREIQRTDTE